MTKQKKKPKADSATIALNRKASFDYAFEEKFEAGIALQGWEVKSLRQGRVQLVESYVLIKRNEAWWLGGHITPLLSASTHITPDPDRTRKLLLRRDQLRKLIGATERKGYTLVPLALYWKRNTIKLEIALAKGKKNFDKREASKKRDWEREKARIMKQHA